MLKVLEPTSEHRRPGRGRSECISSTRTSFEPFEDVSSEEDFQMAGATLSRTGKESSRVVAEMSQVSAFCFPAILVYSQQYFVCVKAFNA